MAPNKSNQTYIDWKEQNNLFKLKLIEVLVKKYPNDADLGEEVRKLISSKKIKR
jgi:hypothetical protein